MKIVQSNGMGVESSALLVEWLENPESRNFELNDLIVMTMQTGDEPEDIKRLNETYILPLLRKHRVRFVELARGGPRQQDGIVVLQDTREPYELHIRGAYRLSDELLRAGTVPQFSGSRRCSLKFKAWVGEQWLAREFGDAPYRHVYGYNADEQSRIARSEEAISAKYRIAFGFNADEQDRIARAQDYDIPERFAEYPISDWGWTRDICDARLFARFGETWQKSACLFCPFNQQVYKEQPRGLVRLRSHRSQLIESLLLERNSFTFNPRGQLYRTKSLFEIVWTHMPDILNEYEALLHAIPWALYRVRRIYMKIGRAERCVERIAIGDRSDILWRLLRIGGQRVTANYIDYAYLIERDDCYPAREEFYSAGPSITATKARYGVERFDEIWIDPQYAEGKGQLSFSFSG